MKTRTLHSLWDQIRQQYGVLLRVVEAIPETDLHTHPIAGMRTPAELAVHVAQTIVRDVAVGVARGEVVTDPSRESAIAAALPTRAALLDHLRDCWRQADAAVATIGDAELAARVPTSWKTSLPGGHAIHVIHDEVLHHRGQLYVYARALGVEPPSNWSFAANAPEFRPRA